VDQAPRHTASCRCGQLRATTIGAPVRISVCHCLACQQRTGSAFSVQGRWPSDRITVEGRSSAWTRTADSGSRATYYFCPDCGSTVHYSNEGKFEGLVAVPLGAFEDPYFARPGFSVWEQRQHDWVEITGESVEHSA
jgi:hypothetical protein